MSSVGLLVLAVSPVGAERPAAARAKGSAKLAPTTARTRLAGAGAEAPKWQADAVLVRFETSTANPDGSAYAWMFLNDSQRQAT